MHLQNARGGMVAGDSHHHVLRLPRDSTEEDPVDELDVPLLSGCVAVVAELVGTLYVCVDHGPLRKLSGEELSLSGQVSVVAQGYLLHSQDSRDANLGGHLYKGHALYAVFLSERRDLREVIASVSEEEEVG